MLLDFWTVHYFDLMKSGKIVEEIGEDESFSIEDLESQWAAEAGDDDDIADEIAHIVQHSTESDWEDV